MSIWGNPVAVCGGDKANSYYDLGAGTVKPPMRLANRVFGPTKNGATDYLVFRDENGENIDVDWSQPFEFVIVFKLAAVARSKGNFCGSVNSAFRAPAIQIRNNNANINFYYSTNGSSWTSGREGIEIMPSGYGGIPIDTWITAKCIWDETYFTVEINDGTTLITKNIQPSAPQYHYVGEPFCIGSQNKDNTYSAKNVYYDLSRCYIKQNGSYLWKPTILSEEGLLEVSENGIYRAVDDDLRGYSVVDVNVPNSYTAADEGKVVVNGALEAQTARGGAITANGTYDTTTNNSVTVNVGGVTPEPPLPSDYQEVKYMDFTPHCGYPVTIPKTFLVEAKMSPDSIAESTVLGYRVSSSNNADFEFGIGSAGTVGWWARGTGRDANLEVPAVAGEVYTARGMAYNLRTTAFVGRYAAYSSSVYCGWNGKIYYVKGWDIDGNLSFKFVPCYRKADNTPGFYDVVADVFYSTLNTTGGGSIALGPDAN